MIASRPLRVTDKTPTSHSFLVRQSLGIGAIAICNSAIAMLMPWYVVIAVGVSEQTDAFFAASALPQFVFLVLTATLLPILVSLLATSVPETFQRDVWSFFCLTLVAFSVLALVLYASSRVWVPLFVPGFTPGGKSLTLTLMRIQLVSMILNAAIVSLWAAHHVRRRFVWVEMSSMIGNVAGILFLVFTLRRFGIVAAAWNTVFFNSLKLLLLLPILRTPLRIDWRTPAIAETWRRLKPLLPTHVYLRTDTLVDRFLTSMTHAGTLSMLYMSQQFYAVGVLLLGKAVVAPMTPTLAVDARSRDWERFKRGYQQRLVLVLVVTSLAGGAIVAGRRFLMLIAGHGGITQQNVSTLWLTMVALAGAFVGGALLQVTAGAFYAAGDTRTPSKISAIIYTIYLPLKVLAFLMYGVIGLASAMSAYALTTAAIQFLSLRRKMAMETFQQRGMAPSSVVTQQQG